MNIDCPHCGVHGSIEDSLAGKKLRCPTCSKVFLLPGDVLPESDNGGMIHQECPHCGVHGSVEESLTGKKLRCPKCSKVFLLPDTVSSEADDGVLVSQAVDLASSETDEQLLAETDSVQEAVEESEAADDTDMDVCSVCSQSFASESLVEIDSKLYCALCQPESEGEEEDRTAEDDLLEIMEEEASDQETGGLFVEEDEFLESDDTEEESTELEPCSVCGESLHPDFLETVGSKRYCALCIPEETEEGEADLVEVEAADTESVQALVDDEDEFEKDEYLRETCSVCGEKFHLDFLQEIDSKFYCGLCQPEVIEEATDEEGEAVAAEETGEPTVAENEDQEVEALQKTKGAKGAVWALIIVSLILAALFYFGR